MGLKCNEKLKNNLPQLIAYAHPGLKLMHLFSVIVYVVFVLGGIGFTLYSKYVGDPVYITFSLGCFIVLCGFVSLVSTRIKIDSKLHWYFNRTNEQIDITDKFFYYTFYAEKTEEWYQVRMNYDSIKRIEYDEITDHFYVFGNIEVAWADTLEKVKTEQEETRTVPVFEFFDYFDGQIITRLSQFEDQLDY